LELLIENDKNKFDKYTETYEKNIFPFVEYFDNEIKKFGYSENSPLGIERDIWDYKQIIQYPIRKLEYSFVLHNCKDFLKPRMKTLDAGCGITPTARWFASKGCEAYGIDLRQDNINYIKKSESFLYDPKVNYSSQNMTSLEFEDDTFDVVTSISVLEHLGPEKDTKAISEMLRVLKAGGKLILTVDFSNREGELNYNIKFGLNLLKSGKIKETMQRLQRSKFLLKRDTAYNHDSLMKRIIIPFKNNIEGDMNKKIYVSVNDIKKFWRMYWQPGFLYTKNEPRTYVSVGLVLSKNNG